MDVFIRAGNFPVIRVDSPGQIVPAATQIYRWNGGSFVGFQEISTNGSAAREAFTVETEINLAAANHNNDSTRNINSKIFKLILE